MKNSTLIFLGALLGLLFNNKYDLVDFIVLIIFISRHDNKIPMVLILLPTFLMLYNKKKFFPNLLDLIDKQFLHNF